MSLSCWHRGTCGTVQHWWMGAKLCEDISVWFLLLNSAVSHAGHTVQQRRKRRSALLLPCQHCKRPVPQARRYSALRSCIFVNKKKQKCVDNEGSAWYVKNAMRAIRHHYFCKQYENVLIWGEGYLNGCYDHRRCEKMWILKSNCFACICVSGSG